MNNPGDPHSPVRSGWFRNDARVDLKSIVDPEEQFYVRTRIPIPTDGEQKMFKAGVRNWGCVSWAGRINFLGNSSDLHIARI